MPNARRKYTSKSRSSRRVRRTKSARKRTVRYKRKARMLRRSRRGGRRSLMSYMKSQIIPGTMTSYQDLDTSRIEVPKGKKYIAVFTVGNAPLMNTRATTSKQLLNAVGTYSVTTTDFTQSALRDPRVAFLEQSIRVLFRNNTTAPRLSKLRSINVSVRKRIL
ncbi:putative viral capsid [Circoviridae 15 LDMD-2013]|uniref:putative viral capsid n=1 Tax=Circoviridae 15 LDMD-2013 TaxID=1379719 RepID=UPI0003845FE8|nr:putative viral capsid [Circoviridae 15 LDMD-2013]AGS36223.1 putative viral capsid [Circoviridae 15 LDMD-2013]